MAIGTKPFSGLVVHIFYSPTDIPTDSSVDTARRHFVQSQRPRRLRMIGNATMRMSQRNRCLIL
mgnify:CR=1 FL=1